MPLCSLDGSRILKPKKREVEKERKKKGENMDRKRIATGQNIRKKIKCFWSCLGLGSHIVVPTFFFVFHWNKSKYFYIIIIIDVQKKNK